MDSKEYLAFLRKFETKKTTDDCYTPPAVYDVVLEWVIKEYGINPEKVIRPFYPGGDYTKEEYPKGWTVVDNPPFSTFTKICHFYEERKIPFFLFAPHLTGFNASMESCFVICGASIVYDNGAEVNTSFRTNLEDAVVRTAPDLLQAIEAIRKDGREKKRFPRYRYPRELFTASMGERIARSGIEFRVRKEEAAFIRRLDDQMSEKKTIFGGGLLLCEEKALEAEESKRRAEESKVIRFELSDRER